MSMLLAVMAVALCVSLPASAQTNPDEGKKLAREAFGLYQKRKYSEALDKFTAAAKQFPSGQVLRMQGYTLLALERWIEAIKVMKKALAADVKPLQPVDAEDTEDQIKKAKSHIVIITIKSDVDGAVAAVNDDDERALPHTYMLAPGKVTFIVKAKGHDTLHREETYAAGKETSLTLNPKKKAPKRKAKPKPKPKPKPEVEEKSDLFSGWFPHQATIGLVTAGAGIVLAGVAMSTGLYGLSLRSAVQDNIDIHNGNYDAQCSQNRDLCLHDIALINSDAQRAKSYQDTGLVTGITAGALVAVGATLWIFAADGPFGSPPPGKDKAVGPSLGCAPNALPSAQGFRTIAIGCHGTF